LFFFFTKWRECAILSGFSLTGFEEQDEKKMDKEDGSNSSNESPLPLTGSLRIKKTVRLVTSSPEETNEFVKAKQMFQKKQDQRLHSSLSDISSLKLLKEEDHRLEQTVPIQRYNIHVLDLFKSYIFAGKDGY
jgi:hypothetical protein